MKKFNVKKRILSFLVIICCLAGSVMPMAVSGGQTSKNSSGDRVVFSNEPSTVLAFTKSVVNANDNYPAPEDDEFTFILQTQTSEGAAWNPASELKYYKLNNATDRERITRVVAGVTVDYFETGLNGAFELKAGQIAQFIGLDIGSSFKITEIARLNYTQIPIEGAPVTGTIGTDGASASITNRYQPPNIIADKAKLEVSKTVTPMADYPIPDTPDFTFLLETSASGSYTKKANEPYKLVYTADKEKAVDSEEHATDENGKFKLKAGQTAVFESLGITEYRVTELPEEPFEDAESRPDWENWWCTGEAVRTGNTQKAPEEIFNNSNLSFAVYKRMEDFSIPVDKDGNPVKFTFQLLDENDAEWQGVHYYIFDTEKRLVETTTADGVIQKVYATDEKGQFSLSAGQTAVFTGIPAGVSYKVREITDPDYEQVKPESQAGYERSVQSIPQTLEFVNQEAPKRLSVTKELNNTKGEAPASHSDKFTFRLLRKETGDYDENGNQTEQGAGAYTAVLNAKYTVGGDSYSTDAKDGTFTLEAYQTARFDALAYDKTYRVVEIDPDGSVSTEYKYSNTTVNKIEGMEGKLTRSEPLNFVITNDYTPDKMDLNLHKINSEDKALQGAEFILCVDESGTPVQTEIAEGTDSAEPIRYTTDKDGNLTIPNIKAGTYYLKEVKAPSGYTCLAKPIKIEIKRHGSDITLTADGIVCGKNAQYNDIIKGLKIEYSQKDSDQIFVTVCNSQLYNLPQTGGAGTLWYLIGGMLLMIAAALILYKNNFAGRCWKN